MPYGIDQADWDAAKSQAIILLADRARLRGMIPYSELCGKITYVNFDPHSAAFSAFLGEISEDESAAGRGMLSSIVVHKAGDMQPGPGFFELAKQMGRNTTDIVSCWVTEIKTVYAYWAKRPAP